MRKWQLLTALAVVGLVTPWSTNAEAGPTKVKVILFDQCDPETFNAALYDGACVPTPKGTVTFQEFLQSLNPHDFGDDRWRNIPDRVVGPPGFKLIAYNKGGEFHSFTEVPEYGPGCVQEINDAIGLAGPPVVDCASESVAATFVAPGQKLAVPVLGHEEHYFMCLIHPWMRTNVKVGIP